MTIKSISLSSLDDGVQRGSLWVVNSGASSAYELVGEIIINVPNTNGQKPDTLKVAQTWVPQDATTLIPRVRLLASSEFRSAVTNGLLTIVSEDTAARLLRQEGAKEEMLRLSGEAKRIRQAGAPGKIRKENVEMTVTGGQHSEDDEDGPVEIFGSDYREENVARLAKNGLEVDENGLSPSFVMFANRLQTEGDLAALNAIRARAKFTRRELKYLSKTMPNHPKTTKALKARVNKFNKAA